jgi:hypothetical protein
MKFLAACNPYKLRNQKMIDNSGVGLQKKVSNDSQKSVLAYHVHPLPEKVVELVWDFGALSEVDYNKYVD